MCMLTVLTWLHEETAVLLPESESWPRHMRHAKHGFRDKARLSADKSWKEVLNSQKNWCPISLILHALTFMGRICWHPPLRGVLMAIKIFCMDPSNPGCQWTAQGSQIGQALEALSNLLPGRKPYNQRYIQQPAICKFLIVDGNGLQVDFICLSKKPQDENHKYATTWFLCARFRLPPGRISSFADKVLEDQRQRQTTSLRAASYIAHACTDALGLDSKHPCTLSRQTNASFSTGIRQSVGAFNAESLLIGISIHSFHALSWISIFKFAVKSLPWWRGITVGQFFG